MYTLFLNWSRKLKITKFSPFLFFTAAVVAAIYTFSAYKLVNSGPNDYVAHAKFAADMINGIYFLPHFLYQLCLIILNYLFGVSLLNASYVVVFMSVFFTYFFSFWCYSKELEHVNRYVLLIAVASLFFMHPINVLVREDGYLYIGYIVANVFHNPTVILLKLLALIHFVLLCYFLGHVNVQKKKLLVFLLAMLTISTLLAKPNYIISLLPALFIYWIVNSNTVSLTQIKVCLVAVVLPAIIVLYFQYYFFYTSNTGNAVGIEFLKVYQMYGAKWTVLPKFIFSLLFVISIFIIYYRRLLSKVDYKMALSLFLVSLFYMYFCYEIVNGHGFGSGNWWWSSQIAMFILGFVSLKYYIKFIDEKISNELDCSLVIDAIPLVLLLAHLYSGYDWVMKNLGGAYY